MVLLLLLCGVLWCVLWCALLCVLWCGCGVVVVWLLWCCCVVVVVFLWCCCGVVVSFCVSPGGRQASGCWAPCCFFSVGLLVCVFVGVFSSFRVVVIVVVLWLLCCGCCVVVVLWLWCGCCVVVVWLLCGCCVVVVWLLCGCCVVVVVLLWCCVSFFSFFMKAILSFCDFWTFFVVFFNFLFICALTFHKCQIVKKAILSLLFFALFLRCAGRRAAPFSVGLFVCVFVCVFSSFRAFLGSWRPRGGGGEGQRLMTADWGLGRGADYRGGKGL